MAKVLTGQQTLLWLSKGDRLGWFLMLTLIAVGTGFLIYQANQTAKGMA